MTSNPNSSQALPAYERKIAQLHECILKLQGQLELELSGLLSPTELVQLWKLRGLVDQTETLLKRSLGEASGAVNEDMLEMVVQVERIIAHADSQIAKWSEL